MEHNEWSIVTDDSSGQSYYYNTITGETSWDLPFDSDAIGNTEVKTADGWDAIFDEASQSYYYFNSITNETSWDNPWNTAAGIDNTAEDKINSIDSEEPEGEVATESPWIECADEETGQVYYFNTVTQETQWEPPTEFINGEAELSIDEFVNNEWIAHLDETSGLYFYENQLTGSTQWEAPEEYKQEEANQTDQALPVESSHGGIRKDGGASGMGLYDVDTLNLPSLQNSKDSARADNQNKCGSNKKESLSNFATVPEEFLAEFLAMESKSHIDSSSNESEPSNSKPDGSDTKNTGFFMDYNVSAIDLTADQISALAVLDAIDPNASPLLPASKVSDIILSLEVPLLQSNLILSHLARKIEPYSIDRFAETHFQYDRRSNTSSSMQTHPLKKMLRHQTEPLKSSLTLLSNAPTSVTSNSVSSSSISLQAEALVIFRIILQFASGSNNSTNTGASATTAVKAINPSTASIFSSSSNSIGEQQSIDQLVLIDSLLLKLLNGPVELQEEAYCQLCKQTRRNPSATNCALVWQLMIICLIAVPPSRRLLPYLINYFNTCLYKATKSGSNAMADFSIAANESIGNETVVASSTSAIDKFVYIALRMCAASARSSSRSELPTQQEIRASLLGESVHISVKSLDGRKHICSVNSFTTIGHLTNAMVSSKFNVNKSQRRIFALYESCTATSNNGNEVESNEVLLPPEERVLDWVARCVRVNSMLKILKNSNVSTTTLEIPSFGTKFSADNTLSPNSASTSFDELPQHLILRARYIFRLSSHVGDSVTADLLYAQATHDLKGARYPHTAADGMLLAAIQLQERFGDFVPGSRSLQDVAKHAASAQNDAAVPSTAGQLSLFSLISPSTVSDGSDNIQSNGICGLTAGEVEQKILRLYRDLKGTPRADAKSFYLQYVDSWKLFGATFFKVSGQINSNSDASDIVLSVSAKSIILLEPPCPVLHATVGTDAMNNNNRNTETFENIAFVAEYSYADVFSWGHSFDSLVLVIGSKASHTKSYFKTNGPSQASQIDSLIQVYHQYYHQQVDALQEAHKQHQTMHRTNSGSLLTTSSSSSNLNNSGNASEQ